MVLITLAILIITVYFFVNLRGIKKNTVHASSETREVPVTTASDCCGAHEVCEFNEIDFNEEIITYYNDEELDVLRNVRESDLTPEQIENLREVLYTLQPKEISKWLISLGRRHIHLPEILKQEARQLAMEQ